MPWNSEHLRTRLHISGFSDAAIKAAWPSWWSKEAELSASAQAELRFSLSRKLGLDPRTLLDDDRPTFVWKDAKFKHFTGERNKEFLVLSTYGIAIGRMLVTATPANIPLVGTSALHIRSSILATKPFVRLSDLLGLCWGLGIPVIQIRVFPLPAKRMCAMAIRASDRYAILIGKDSRYPANIAYYIAHELGHIALNHLAYDTAVIDLDDPLYDKTIQDKEEDSADQFALELLTGLRKPQVESVAKHFTSQQLAANLLRTSKDTRIEPGTLALCFGYTTGDWAKAHAALKAIYAQAKPVWKEVNMIAYSQIDWDTLPTDLTGYLQILMGALSDADDGN